MFFLKYEGGGGQIDPPPQEKLPSKSPALLGLKDPTLTIRIIFYLKQQYIHLSRYFQATYI